MVGFVVVAAADARMFNPKNDHDMAHQYTHERTRAAHVCAVR